MSRFSFHFLFCLVSPPPVFDLYLCFSFTLRWFVRVSIVGGYQFVLSFEFFFRLSFACLLLFGILAFLDSRHQLIIKDCVLLFNLPASVSVFGSMKSMKMSQKHPI